MPPKAEHYKSSKTEFASVRLVQRTQRLRRPALSETETPPRAGLSASAPQAQRPPRSRKLLQARLPGAGTVLSPILVQGLACRQLPKAFACLVLRAARLPDWLTWRTCLTTALCSMFSRPCFTSSCTTRRSGAPPSRPREHKGQALNTVPPDRPLQRTLCCTLQAPSRQQWPQRRLCTRKDKCACIPGLKTRASAENARKGAHSKVKK